jgi:hypothetical protein
VFVLVEIDIIPVDLIPDDKKHPFLWNDSLLFWANKKPTFRKWIYDPFSHVLLVGPYANHLDLIPQSHKNQDVLLWVRGFFFPKKKILATRPFPNGHEEWSIESIKRSQEIQSCILMILAKQLNIKKTATDVNNLWLNKNIEERNW